MVGFPGNCSRGGAGSARSTRQGLLLGLNVLTRLFPSELPRRTLRRAAAIVAAPRLYVEAV
jgi:hypothetical protein